MTTLHAIPLETVLNPTVTRVFGLFFIPFIAFVIAKMHQGSADLRVGKVVLRYPHRVAIGIATCVLVMVLFVFFPLFSLAVIVVAFGFGVMMESVEMRRQSRQDMREAEGTWAKISAYHGWTHAARVGRREHKPLMGFPMLIGAYALLGIFGLAFIGGG